MNKCVVLMVAVLLSMDAFAEPKAELGIGLAAQNLRDYRGSTHSQTQAVPFPFVIYRGERIQANRDEVTGRFLYGNNWELNASAEAALNGGSADNPLRVGMPELKSTGEIGPSLNFNLSGQDFDEGWSLRLPVRAVLAVDFSSIEHIGFNANPKLTYREPDFFGWKGKVDLGFLWATGDYHNYYYQVEDRYVTAERSAYNAKGGFSGSYLKFSLKRHFGRWWLGWNLRYDNLQGTVFEDSPLMETDHYYATTFAVGYFFWRSND